MFSLMERMRSASLARDEDKIPLMVSVLCCVFIEIYCFTIAVVFLTDFNRQGKKKWKFDPKNFKSANCRKFYRSGKNKCDL
jgi:hypothetical protein